VEKWNDEVKSVKMKGLNFIPIDLSNIPTFQYSNIPWVRQKGWIFLNTLQLSLGCRNFEI
jgi:hypothetical protein